MVVCAYVKKTLAELPVASCWMAIAAGALTVAGQWRSFTAFPSILTF